MYKSATLKLTVFYILAITFVCLIFSVSIYGLASSRIDREAERQARIIQEFNIQENEPTLSSRPGGQLQRPLNLELRNELRDQIEADRNQLLVNILITNALIICVGAVASYFFARSTMRPIAENVEKQRRFTADASHELKTPLAVMKAEIDVALHQDLNVQQLKEVLESNLEEVERLKALSEQLLTLTSIEDAQTLQEEINLSILVQTHVKKFSERYKVAITTSIDDSICVRGVDALLENYLQILLDNAVKYSRDQEPQIMVSLKKDKHQNVTLSVQDKGIGISKPDLNKIFDRFYRSNQVKEQGKSGYGLGLSLASQIAKIHGSKVEVDSKLGELTTFSLKLKVC